jgi:hypothetical protein
MFCRLRYREPHGLVLAIPADDPETAAVCDQQTIPLLTTQPNLGGQRFWFQCECGRRVGRLYLPGGQRVFRCRQCYDLTYESAQTHGNRRDRMSRNYATIEAALNDSRWDEKVLGQDAARLWYERQQRARRRRAKQRSRRDPAWREMVIRAALAIRTRQKQRLED